MLNEKRNKQADEPRLISARELAALLNVSASSVWRMRAAGQLPPAVRVGRRGVRWRLSDIKAFISQL